MAIELIGDFNGKDKPCGCEIILLQEEPLMLDIRFCKVHAEAEATLLKVAELERAAEGGLRITCDNAYHDRGHGICSFCVQKRIDTATSELRSEIERLLAQWEYEKERQVTQIAGMEKLLSDIHEAGCGLFTQLDPRSGVGYRLSVVWDRLASYAEKKS